MKYAINGRSKWFFLFVVLTVIVSSHTSLAEGSKIPNLTLHLVRGAMSEDVKDHQQYNESILFSITLEKAVCYTLFDQIKENTFVYHNWYKRDKLNSSIKLNLQSPRWSTFSRIHFREGDKGPWRVDVLDAKGNLISTYRFSVTD